MTPAEMTALVKGMQELLDIFSQVGLPGLLLMILLAPALLLMLILYMNHLATVRMEKAQTEHRSNTMDLLEAYREDTQVFLREMGGRHQNLIRLHENTLLQLQSSEQRNASMHTLIVNNTAAMEQLKIIIQRS